MFRVHILGASGSGVSTLGENLGLALSIPVFDCDNYYWEKTDPPFLKATPVVERQKALLNDLSPDASWICSGSMDSWSEPFEAMFTHIIFLYVHQTERINRLRQREKTRWGSRVLPGGDMYSESEKFFTWASHYDDGSRNGRSLPRHRAWLERQTSPILTIEGTLTSQDVLERALAFLDLTRT